jgi:hypothetical protein
MAVLLIDTVASPLIDKTVLPHALGAPPEWARIPPNRLGQMPRPGPFRGIASAFVTFDPIDPPLPVPDVPGADVDAHADGLPPRSALSPRSRMVVEASAVGDLALRTCVDVRARHPRFRDFSDGWEAVGFFSRGLRVKGQSSP